MNKHIKNNHHTCIIKVKHIGGSSFSVHNLKFDLILSNHRAILRSPRPILNTDQPQKGGYSEAFLYSHIKLIPLNKCVQMQMLEPYTTPAALVYSVCTRFSISIHDIKRPTTNECTHLKAIFMPGFYAT